MLLREEDELAAALLDGAAGRAKLFKPPAPAPPPALRALPAIASKICSGERLGDSGVSCPEAAKLFGLLAMASVLDFCVPRLCKRFWR